MTKRLFLSTTPSLGNDLFMPFSHIVVSLAHVGSSWVHLDLLLLAEMKSFYRQLSTRNFCSSKIVNADCSLMKSHQVQLPFLSSSEPSSCDDVVPHVMMLFVRRVSITFSLGEMFPAIHQLLPTYLSCI